MSQTSDSTLVADRDDDRGPLLPVEPYRSLRASFGMLLGVADIEILSAYQRGKMWLHNAWLHGQGCVWGLDVQLDPPHGEVRVLPGLALDALGRELHLDQDVCLNLGRWFEEHRQHDALQVTHPGDDPNLFRFDAHVVAQFKACLARPVPALAEPCEGAATTTSYSRVWQAIELRLVPGLPPAPPADAPPGPQSFPRLRLLLNLSEPRMEDGAVVAADQEVLDRRAAIQALPPPQQPAALLAAFRALAALDAMDRRPAQVDDESPPALFPAVEPAPLVLAHLTELTLSSTAAGWELVGGHVDNSVRPALLDTATIQELLAGSRPAGEGGSGGNNNGGNDNGGNNNGGNNNGGNGGGEVNSGGAPSERVAVDAGGPRLDSEKVQFDADARTIRLPFDRDVLTNSLKGHGLRVHSFEVASGWRVEPFEVTFDRGGNHATITLTGPQRGDTLRLVVRGTGDTPVLGGGPGRRIPFAGIVGGPPSGPHEGRDFSLMIPQA